LHEKHGFKLRNRVTIWKEPLKVRMRTMVRSLMHKLIVEDSTECFTAMPDYVLIFKKNGVNEVPVTHPVGLSYYAGANPILAEMSEKYGTFEQLTKKYKGWEDPKTNKLSHIIWQRYASSVWDDIRIDEVLQYKESKDEDDEKDNDEVDEDDSQTNHLISIATKILELPESENNSVARAFAGAFVLENSKRITEISAYQRIIEKLQEKFAEAKENGVISVEEGDLEEKLQVAYQTIEELRNRHLLLSAKVYAEQELDKVGLKADTTARKLVAEAIRNEPTKNSIDEAIASLVSVKGTKIQSRVGTEMLREDINKPSAKNLEGSVAKLNENRNSGAAFGLALAARMNNSRSY